MIRKLCEQLVDYLPPRKVISSKNKQAHLNKYKNLKEETCLTKRSLIYQNYMIKILQRYSNILNQKSNLRAK